MTDRYGPRPQLGELKVGQRVMVYRSHNQARGKTSPEDRSIDAVVTAVGRVWAKVERAGGVATLTWRMRLDTQDEGTQYSGNNAKFATLDQYRWDQNRYWALQLLEENGIQVKPRSRWHGSEVRLADIISAGLDRTEPL